MAARTNRKRPGRVAPNASAAPRPKASSGAAAHLSETLKPVTPKSRQLNIVARNQADADRETAKVALSQLPSALVAVDFARPTSGELSLMEAIGVLHEKSGAVNDGNLKDAEAMLMGQAVALNTIFGELARRAALNMGEYMEATDKYMRLALKAQGQCRATIETLAAMKNPPVLFAKQANIANGPQQVNNGTPPRARAEDATIAPNGLLEASTGERLDTNATAGTGKGDTALAALGAIDGTAHR